LFSQTTFYCNFVLSNGNVNRLCWGATCQGYIWPTDEKVKKKGLSLAVLLTFLEVVYAFKNPSMNL